MCDYKYTKEPLELQTYLVVYLFFTIFMDMGEALQKILEQLIVKKYNSLIGVDVSNFYMNEDWYRITYYFNPPLEHKDAIEIMEETATLYKMLGPSGKGDIIVDFKKVEDK